MRKTLKGGIETIIAVIILVGLVLALIIAAVLPTMDGGQELAKDAVGRLGTLDAQIDPTGNLGDKPRWDKE